VAPVSDPVVLGMIGGAGIALVVSGCRRTPARSAGRSRRPLQWIRLDPDQVLLPVAFGAAALLLTRWPGAAVVGLVAGRAVARRRRRQVDEATRAEAIALLIEQLKNAAGAADGIETVLTNAARHAPAVIRDDVVRGTARLAYASLDVVLDDLAEALDHPSGDQVVRAIGQVAAHGGSLQSAMDRLARRTQALAEMHRRIEVAREQPRSTMRTVTVVIGAFTALLFLGARDWMSPYGTLVGQLVLLLITCWFALWFRYMGQLARIEPISRFYGRAGELGDAGPPARGGR
jgi:Flp pilus assembly protein TadB